MTSRRSSSSSSPTGHPVRADGLQRSLGLPGVHQQRIPAGGLFTGAEGIKTAEEVAKWGGIAGEQYDPCYHLVCDTIDNVNETALDTNLDAMAFTLFHYATDFDEFPTVAGTEAATVKATVVSDRAAS